MVERPGGGVGAWAFSVPFAWRKRRMTEATAIRAAPGLWPLLRCAWASVWTIRRATYASTRQVSVSSYNLFFQLMYSVCI